MDCNYLASESKTWVGNLSGLKYIYTSPMCLNLPRLALFWPAGLLLASRLFACEPFTLRKVWDSLDSCWTDRIVVYLSNFYLDDRIHSETCWLLRHRYWSQPESLLYLLLDTFYRSTSETHRSHRVSFRLAHLTLATHLPSPSPPIFTLGICQ